MIHDDDRVRQRPGDRGPVDRARVDRHERDLVLPVLAAVIQPPGDRVAGPPGDLAEQPAGAGQVSEVRLEPLGPQPTSRSRSSVDPFRRCRGGSHRCPAPPAGRGSVSSRVRMLQRSAGA